LNREKVADALEHREGVIPIDLGSTAVTGMHVSVVEKLRAYYGLPSKPVKVIEPYQMLGYIDEQLRDVLKIDTIGVPTENTIFGFPLAGEKEWMTPWGQLVLVPEAFEITENEKEVFVYPQADRNAAASGRMPKSSFFFDTIERQEPIDEDKLDPNDNLEEFGLLSDEQIDYYRIKTEAARKSGNAVVTAMPGTAFGDIALVPAPFLKEPKGIRNIAEWYMSTAIRQDYIHKVFEQQLEYAIENLKKLHAAAGDNIDVLFICGTDFGTQTGRFCSIEAFQTLWKPYYQKLNGWIHENTSWKTFKHSCGAIFELIEELIDSGFDILNPVQCSATGMEPSELKRQYGSRIVFWGGGVDTQKILPFGTPEEVREDVENKCRVFSKDGGFVFNSIHNVQAMTPVENVVAMFETVWDINK
jgi:hypothetical protein